MKIDSRELRIEDIAQAAISLRSTLTALERLLDRAEADDDLDVEPITVAEVTATARRLAAEVKLLSDGAA